MFYLVFDKLILREDPGMLALIPVLAKQKQKKANMNKTKTNNNLHILQYLICWAK